MGTGVFVEVKVLVWVGIVAYVEVGVFVGVGVSVHVGVSVGAGVSVRTGVSVGTGVLVQTISTDWEVVVGVRDGYKKYLVDVEEAVGVAVEVGVGVGVVVGEEEAVLEGVEVSSRKIAEGLGTPVSPRVGMCPPDEVEIKPRAKTCQPITANSRMNETAKTIFH